MDIAFKILSFGIPFAIEAYKKGKEETKFFEILPWEYNKEIKLAEERKKNGDTFNPSYEEYINILKKGYSENKKMKIKWERHFSKSQWTVFAE